MEKIESVQDAIKKRTEILQKFQETQLDKAAAELKQKCDELKQQDQSQSAEYKHSCKALKKSHKKWSKTLKPIFSKVSPEAEVSSF